MTAATTILQTQTVADAAGGWSVPLSFGQFDPSFGTLGEVDVGLVGDVKGTAAIENLGAAATGVLIELPGIINVAGPADTILAAVHPDAIEALILGAYDGTADFAGASGTVVSSFSNVVTVVSTVAATGNQSPFVGTGTVDLIAGSQLASTIVADGNLLSLTTGKIGAVVNVQYGYTPNSGGSDGTSSGGTQLGSSTPVSALLVGSETTAVQTLRIADAMTGWKTVLAANKFDPTLGTLETVNLTLITDINGGLAVENLGSASASVTMSDTAYITLTLPGGIGTVSADPYISSGANLTGFDGTIDFAGSSGRNLTGLMNTQTVTSQFFSSYSDLSAFLGIGTIALSAVAISPSVLNGPADLAAELLTEAGATVEISYTYIPATDSPTLITTGTVPVISETEAGLRVTNQTTVGPFANVVITDPNVAQTETVTVTESVAANGRLSNLGGGSYNITTGVYTETGSAAVVTAALRGLVFTPTANNGAPVTTGFSIGVTDTALASASDDATSVVATAGVFIDTVAAAAEILAVLNVDSVVSVAGADQAVACFAAGTRIATTRGAIAVERLRAGDTVITVSGLQQKIEWIGRRKLDCRKHPTPDRVRPVRIAAHAFGENRPKRALLLSPDHSVFVEDVLIPIKFLINDLTVVQIDAAAVTYYHVELPRHDVLLAEGLPAESYLETGGRSAFENGGGVMQLHPDFAPDEALVGMVWQNFSYAPLVGTDGQLERVRARLALQAVMLGSQADDVALATGRPSVRAGR